MADLASTCRISPSFAPIEEALIELRAGRMLVVVDDVGRENYGSLTLGARWVTPEAVSFMAKEARGLICLALDGRRCDELGLAPMAGPNQSPSQPAFAVSIEAREGVSTGISAADRAHTIRVATDPTASAGDLVSPGHVVPVRARDGGLLERRGHAEAAVDLARLAGFAPAAVTCEVMDDDGDMARGGALTELAARHGLKAVRIADVVDYRRRHDHLVERAVCAALPSRVGAFEVIGYRSRVGTHNHVALVAGELAGHDDVLAYVHAGSAIGDAFGASGKRLQQALRQIATEGRGVLVYLTTEDGATGGLLAMSNSRLDARPARLLGDDAQATAAQILADLGPASIQILSDDQSELEALERFGLTVSGRTPLRRTRSVVPQAQKTPLTAQIA